MYKINQYANINNIDIKQNELQIEKNIKLQKKKQIRIENQLEKQLSNHYNHYNHNNYCENDNNELQYIQQQSLIDDINKMHLIPPHCPMTPHSYTDFFNNNIKLDKVAPYKIKIEEHPKDGYPKTKLEYNNFYSDFKKDALNYNTPRMAEYENLQFNKQNNKQSNKQNNLANKLANELDNENVKIYRETKNKTDFAIPMNSNGSNKLEYLYNDCLNKSTFNYKRFGYDNTIKHMSNADNWVDNALFNIDISEDTNNLYDEYMNNRFKNGSQIYDSVFEDMTIMSYNPSED